ncbi:MAG: efflux transporter, family, subunit [Chitinophagaceae bacterium]|nr:efflux transporter, family, subunit [Chitinophagaceae bacterium]
MKSAQYLISSLSRIIFIFMIALLAYSCGSSSAGNMDAAPAQALPVFSVSNQSLVTYTEYTASLEGVNDIEIRPQVDGYLDKIYVEEGASVKEGQLLFKINDRPYREQFNSAKANLLSAKAASENAQIQLNKLTPLVKNNVISEVQLKSAEASYDAAKANEAHAEAMVQAAKINLDYTSITAPADGYIGRTPFKTGSLVSTTSATALTTLSGTKEIRAYFSMSEVDFLKFKNQFPGVSLEEKMKHIPLVELELADKSMYAQKGKVELAEGQFDKTTGTINFRATFSNTHGLLHSGSTGKIKIPRQVEQTIVVPQEATFELQDKIFVFVVADSNKVISKPITVSGTSGNYYLVAKGLTVGEKIVYTGIDRLRDGVVINPQHFSLDSLLKTQAL